MSLGATASQPARARLTEVRESSSSDASLSTRAVGRQQPAVAVARVLAETHVADDDEVGIGLLDGARGELDDALVVPRTGALLVLVRGDAEQHEPGDAAVDELARLADRLVDAEAVDARHRVDRLAAVQAGLDEHREQQVLR